MILHWKARDRLFPLKMCIAFFLQLATLRRVFLAGAKASSIYNAPVGCFARIIDMDTSNSAVQIVFFNTPFEES